MLDTTSHAHLPPSSWNDERTELLKKLWSDGLSGSQIAYQIGCGFSRNAIIGKAMRLGLPKRAVVKARNKDRANSDRRATQRIKVLKLRHASNGGAQIVECVVREELPTPAEFLGVAFLDLDHTHCRFPRGDGASILFCGQARIAGRPYCVNCCRIAYDSVRSVASSVRAYTADAQRRAFGT